jgi:oxygen-dependent protoporphyrinogen oxidase
MAQRVVVVGGGISGLAAAFHLRELAAAHAMALEAIVLEAGSRAGGALHTIARDGFVLEAGADSFISDKTDALDLAGRLGLDAEIVGTLEAHRGAFVVHRGKLVDIPRGFSLLAPSMLMPIIESPLFSIAGKFRMLAEPMIRARDDDSDESLAAFIRRRFGAEALDRLVQPLAGGIYVADPETLSMRTCFARFVAMEREHGSLIRALRAPKKSPAGGGVSGVRWNLFLSFRDGIATLVRALEHSLGDAIHFGAEVAEIAWRAPGWTVATRDGRAFEAAAIIVAAPSYAAARILKTAAPALSRALAEIEYASSATVNLAYDAGAVAGIPDGFGVVMPATERRRIIALSFSSLKFSNRAPAGKFLMRAFLGGALNPEMMRLEAPAMVDVVREELRGLLGIRTAPLFTHVWRWLDSMPQYKLGHLERVAEIERQAAGLAGFALAGAAYRGVGIPDCVRSGALAAETVFSQLTPRD